MGNCDFEKMTVAHFQTFSTQDWSHSLTDHSVPSTHQAKPNLLGILFLMLQNHHHYSHIHHHYHHYPKHIYCMIKGIKMPDSSPFITLIFLSTIHLPMPLARSLQTSPDIPKVVMAQTLLVPFHLALLLPSHQSLFSLFPLSVVFHCHCLISSLLQQNKTNRTKQKPNNNKKETGKSFVQIIIFGRLFF